LTRVIKEDITALNHQIEALQNHVQCQRLLHKNKQTESHAAKVVSSLKSKLTETAKLFQWALEMRTKVECFPCPLQPISWLNISFQNL